MGASGKTKTASKTVARKPSSLLEKAQQSASDKSYYSSPTWEKTTKTKKISTPGKSKTNLKVKRDSKESIKEKFEFVGLFGYTASQVETAKVLACSPLHYPVNSMSFAEEHLSFLEGCMFKRIVRLGDKGDILTELYKIQTEYWARTTSPRGEKDKLDLLRGYTEFLHEFKDYWHKTLMYKPYPEAFYKKLDLMEAFLNTLLYDTREFELEVTTAISSIIRNGSFKQMR